MTSLLFLSACGSNPNSQTGNLSQPRISPTPTLQSNTPGSLKQMLEGWKNRILKTCEPSSFKQGAKTRSTEESWVDLDQLKRKTQTGGLIADQTGEFAWIRGVPALEERNESSTEKIEGISVRFESDGTQCKVWFDETLAAEAAIGTEIQILGHYRRQKLPQDGNILVNSQSAINDSSVTRVPVKIFVNPIIGLISPTSEAFSFVGKKLEESGLNSFLKLGKPDEGRVSIVPLDLLEIPPLSPRYPAFLMGPTELMRLNSPTNHHFRFMWVIANPEETKEAFNFVTRLEFTGSFRFGGVLSVRSISLSEKSNARPEYGLTCWMDRFKLLRDISSGLGSNLTFEETFEPCTALDRNLLDSINGNDTAKLLLKTYVNQLREVRKLSGTDWEAIARSLNI